MVYTILPRWWLFLIFRDVELACTLDLFLPAIARLPVENGNMQHDEQQQATTERRLEARHRRLLPRHARAADD